MQLFSSINKTRFGAFIAFFALWQTVHAAPRIPSIVKDNGLVFCANNANLSFNPQNLENGKSSNIVTSQIYNRLFSLTPHSMQVVPELAKGYQYLDNGKTLMIYLRRGVKFHHTDWFTPSRNFNAEDVVFSLNRMLGKSLDFPSFADLASPRYEENSQNQIYHNLAKKLRFPYFESIKLNEKIEEVTAQGKYTVKIRLKNPDYSLLSHLASPYAIIFSYEYALQLNADDNLSAFDAFPVGTGAYQMKNYFRNQYVRLVRNEHYWKNSANIRHLIVDLSNNQSGRLLKFLNEECQIVSSPELSQLNLLGHSAKKNYLLMPAIDINATYLALNLERPLMQNKALRQALSQAINRQRLVDRIYYGNAYVAHKVLPSFSWAGKKDKSQFHYHFDGEKAKNYLAPLNISLNLWVVKEERDYNLAPVDMAELIRQDLNEAGVKTNIRYISTPELHQHLAAKTADYDLILTGWMSQNVDPDTFLHPILSCQSKDEATNLSHWCSSKFDELLDNALKTPNQQERTKLYLKAQEIVLEELPILLLTSAKRLLVINERVKGIKKTPFGDIQFSELSLKTEGKK